MIEEKISKIILTNTEADSFDFKMLSNRRFRSVNEIHIYGLNDILSGKKNPKIYDTFLTHIYPKLIINHVNPFIGSFIGELVDSPQYLSNKFIIVTDLES